MDKRVFGVYLELIGSTICNRLMKERGIDENTAISVFVSSNTYELLSIEENELFMFSPNKIYQMLINELDHNEVY